YERSGVIRPSFHFRLPAKTVLWTGCYIGVWGEDGIEVSCNEGICKGSVESTQKGGTGHFGVVVIFTRREPCLGFILSSRQVWEDNRRMNSHLAEERPVVALATGSEFLSFKNSYEWLSRKTQSSFCLMVEWVEVNPVPKVLGIYNSGGPRSLQTRVNPALPGRTH
ncbi:hypothetical protein PIB30_080413, partial [Stylosanthes scabra]|nr:hypothetical protein [Stylosanthes scabra]